MIYNNLNMFGQEREARMLRVCMYVKLALETRVEILSRGPFLERPENFSLQK